MVVIQKQHMQAIALDWSHILDRTQECEDLLQWVASYPQKKDLHITLGKVRGRKLGRQLQATLQSLGCTVTCKQFAM